MGCGRLERLAGRVGGQRAAHLSKSLRPNERGRKPTTSQGEIEIDHETRDMLDYRVSCSRFSQHELSEE